MLGYKIKDSEGWVIAEKEFDEALKKLYPTSFVGDRRDMRGLVMKVYGVNEGDKMVGRIDVTYEGTQTKVLITGEKHVGLAAKLVEGTNFNWEVWD